MVLSGRRSPVSRLWLRNLGTRRASPESDTTVLEDSTQRKYSKTVLSGRRSPVRRLWLRYLGTGRAYPEPEITVLKDSTQIQYSKTDSGRSPVSRLWQMPGHKESKPRIGCYSTQRLTVEGMLRPSTSMLASGRQVPDADSGGHE